LIPVVLLLILVATQIVVIRKYGLWRWFSGHTHDGYHHTNATWTRRSHGDRPVLHPTGNAIRWHHWPRWWRAGIRTGGTLILDVAAFGFAFYRPVAEGISTIVFVAAAYLGCWAAYRKVRDWRHTRDWVNPLNEGLPPAVTVREIARDRTRTVLALAPGVLADDKLKQLVMLTASAKLDLPLADLKGDWSKLHGKKPEAVITLVPPPPGYVSFGDICPYADDAEEHEFVPGLTRPDRQHPKGSPVVISVNGDSPHLGFSIGSGGGKSVAARNAGAQLAHHGALVVVLDTKLISHHWAAGLPNVAYARAPAELHELAIWLAGEVDRRNAVALQHADVEGKVHINPGPRIIGLLEELNATQAVLNAYWKEIGGKGKSPAVTALDKVAFTGRQVGVNLIYIGQRLSAKAVSGGSGDARENLGVLFMRNPAKRTWDMLVGDRHALPSATDVDGRLQIVTPKEVIEVQGAYLTGAQAREYATSGVVAVPREDMPCVGGLAPVGTPERAAQDVPDNHAIEGHGPDLHIVRNSPGHPPLEPPRITIPEAIAEGISGPTYDAVRKALARYEGPKPQPVGRRGNADEYDRIEWCDWEEARRQPRRLVR
jgi:hypothetical protein